jgi:hypothetical protein
MGATMIVLGIWVVVFAGISGFIVWEAFHATTGKHQDHERTDEREQAARRLREFSIAALRGSNWVDIGFTDTPDAGFTYNSLDRWSPDPGGLWVDRGTTSFDDLAAGSFPHWLVEKDEQDKHDGRRTNAAGDAPTPASIDGC